MPGMDLQEIKKQETAGLWRNSSASRFLGGLTRTLKCWGSPETNVSLELLEENRIV